MFFILLAQATQPSIIDPLAWVGNLTGPALTGVLLYYLITKALPNLQDRFHDALEKERVSRELLATKSFDAHREAVTRIIERDETRTEKILTKLDQLPEKLRCDK